MLLTRMTSRDSMAAMSDSGEERFRYVPTRQRDVDWGLYATGAGYMSCPAGYKSYPVTPHPTAYYLPWNTGRKLPEYQAVYVTRGRGEFESTPTGHVEIGEGTVFLLFPDVWHRYRPSMETGWDEYWISFSGDTMDRLVEEGFFSAEHPVHVTGVDETILTPYRSLLERLQGEVAGFPQLVAANTMEILAAVLAAGETKSADLAGSAPSNAVTVSDRLVADALRIIWEQSERDLTVGDVASQMPLTQRSLERRFREALGHTIHDEIIRCRLERARRLLAKTDLSIKEVAAASGFPNPDNMGRAFQRFEGVSPSEYRGSHRET